MSQWGSGILNSALSNQLFLRNGGIEMLQLANRQLQHLELQLLQLFVNYYLSRNANRSSTSDMTDFLSEKFNL
jgi:hypothetical protein